uniref:Uncharacterized protein n=1 Tax=Arundo donax TaxID=35708 RepID=A0A0A9FHB5_ARUDO
MSSDVMQLTWLGGGCSCYAKPFIKRPIEDGTRLIGILSLTSINMHKLFLASQNAP